MTRKNRDFTHHFVAPYTTYLSTMPTKTKLRANKKGGKVKIELTVREYEKLLDDLDELDAIRA